MGLCPHKYYYFVEVVVGIIAEVFNDS